MALAGKKAKNTDKNPADDIEAAIAAEMGEPVDPSNAEDGDDKVFNEEQVTTPPDSSDADKKEAADKKDASAPRKPTSKKAATKTIAKRESTAIMSGKGIFIDNPQLQEVAEEAEFGDLPKIVPTQGILKDQDSKEKLGEYVDFQPVYAKTRWCVSPGSNDEESKEYFVVDYDSPDNLQDALKEAQSAGYNKAAIKRYLEVYGLIVNCEKESDFVGELVQFQLAPSSVRQWKKFANKLKVQAALGKLKGNIIIRARAIPDSWDGNDFTRFGFELVKS